MNTSIELDDLRINACQKLVELSEIAADATLPAEKQCRLFDEQASRLMALLHTAFNLTGIASRKADELKDAAQIWKSLVDVCDTVLKVLAELHAKNPECVGDYYYDKALDYRNAANSRYLIHS